MRSNEVLLAGLGRHPMIWRGTVETLSTQHSLEHGPLHLLVKNLVRHLGQSMILVALFVHSRELSHIYEPTIKDDLSLGIIFIAYKLIGLDTAFTFECR